jgi:hypothetical protein
MQRIHDRVCLRHEYFDAVPPEGTWTVLCAAQILFLWLSCRTHIKLRSLAATCYFLMRMLWITLDSTESCWPDHTIAYCCCDGTVAADVVAHKRFALDSTDWRLYCHPPFLTFSFLHSLREFLGPDDAVRQHLPGVVRNTSRPLRQIVYDYAGAKRGLIMFFTVWARTCMQC